MTREGGGQWKKILFAWVISMVIVVILCAKTGVRLQDVFWVIMQADPLWLAGIFLFSALVHILLGSYKWLLILKGIGCKTSYGEVVFVRMGSDPIRFAMPFKLGELSNLLYFTRVDKLPLGESASWVLFDKALNFLGTLIWLAVGIILTLSAPEYLKWPVIIGGGLLALLVIARPLPDFIYNKSRKIHPKLGSVMEQLLATFRRISIRRRLSLIGVAAVFQLRPLIICGLLFMAFGQVHFRSVPGVGELLSKGSAVVVASNFPGPQAGIGPRETALFLLFREHLAGEGDEEIPDIRREGTHIRPEDRRPAPAHPGTVLISIGILMAIAIHVVPAVLGLPLMASLISALEVGRKPIPADELDEDERELFTQLREAEMLDKEPENPESEEK